MSSNLTAEPINRKKLDLGTSLKFALRKCLSEPINAEIGESFIPILKGIMAAGDDSASKDADKLIQFIEKYGQIYLKEEY